MRSIFIGVALVAAALPALAGAALPESAAVARGADYIRTTQQPDGGFGGFGAGQTFDAIFALRAAGIAPATVKKDGKSPADFIQAVAKAQDKPGSAGKAALAALALGLDPKSVNGTNFIDVVNRGLDPATGRYGADDFTQATAILGLACTSNAVPATATTALKTSQLKDGGWGFAGASDPDTSAIALQALLAAGLPKTDGSVTAAVAYFKATQGKDGGWGFDPEESNANSTAFAIQALIAAGEDPESATYRKGATTPVAYLVAQQQPDGSFKGFDPAFAANQALPALAGLTYCAAPRAPLKAEPSPTPAPASPTPRPTTAPLPPNTGSGARDETGALMMLSIAGAALLVAPLVLRLRRRQEH
jgi:hypothetical protein